MTDLQAKFTEFFTQIYQSINFEFIIKFVIVYFFLIWISLVVWVLKDIRNRTTNVFFQIFCLIVAVIPFFGIFVYLLFRPSRTLYEKYYEEIEENLTSIPLKKIFLNILRKKSDYIKYGMEIIYKNRDKEYFETWYLRNESIEVLKAVEDFSKLDIRIKITDKYYFNLLDEIFSAILNLSLLTNSIMYLLKDRENFIKPDTSKENLSKFFKYNYAIEQLIKVNQIIRNGGKEMDKNLKASIKTCASEVVRKFIKDNSLNKLASYRQKLLSSVVAKNHKRILDVLTQLSVYSGVYFSFAFDYIENQTQNEDIIHYFILELDQNRLKNKENEDKE